MEMAITKISTTIAWLLPSDPYSRGSSLFFPHPHSSKTHPHSIHLLADTLHQSVRSFYVCILPFKTSVKNVQRFITVLLVIFSSFCALGQDQTWTETQQLAKEEDRKVLLVFSGSDWCRGCILFDQQVLQDEVFQDFATENLAFYKADFPRKNKNKPTPEVIRQNEQLIIKYNPNGMFPYVLLLDENEQVLLEAEGNIDPDDFLSSLREAAK